MYNLVVNSPTVGLQTVSLLITQLATVSARVPGLGMFKPQNFQIKKQTTAIFED